MKRFIISLFCAIVLAGCSEFEVGNVDGLNIKYTTSDNQEVSINTLLFDRWTVSHRYENGVGIIEFKKPITSIPDEIFSNCVNLTSIELPGTITSIGEDAFYNCVRLKSITIPNSVTEIGDFAFFCCSSLTSVYCKAKTPPTGGTSMFNGNAMGRKIYVPTTSVSAYKCVAGWSNYSDSIVGYDF